MPATLDEVEGVLQPRKRHVERIDKRLDRIRKMIARRGRLRIRTGHRFIAARNLPSERKWLGVVQRGPLGLLLQRDRNRLECRVGVVVRLALDLADERDTDGLTVVRRNDLAENAGVHEEQQLVPLDRKGRAVDPGDHIPPGPRVLKSSSPSLVTEPDPRRCSPDDDGKSREGMASRAGLGEFTRADYGQFYREFKRPAFQLDL